jgi:hypothetical protein
LPQANLVQFLHAACGSPVPSTWIKAIDSGHFATWPGLTANLVRKHLPKSTTTVKGHLNQQRKNLWSTKPKQAPLNNQPISESLNNRTHQVVAAVYDATGQIATDQTGKFPTTSSRGHKYLLILYDYHSNSILAKTMRNCSTEPLQAYNNLHQYLVKHGFKPQLQNKLDNEASKALNQSIQEKGIDYQLVPPHIHQQNAAGQAIQTFQNHFVVCLSTTNKNFPFTCGITFCPKPFRPSISFSPPASTLDSQQKNNRMEHSTSIARP